MLSALLCLLISLAEPQPQKYLIVITHGRQQDVTFPQWPRELATAINVNLGKPASDKELNQSIVNLSGAVNPKGSKQFLLFDWSPKSPWANTADEPEVAGKLAESIKKKIALIEPNSENKVNLILIGHSRGCYVLCEACRGVTGISNRLRFVQLITLDAQALGKDGVLEANPGGIIDWATNYYQTIAGLGDLRGEDIDNALNINLDNNLKNWVPLKKETRHSQVYRWYQGLWHPGNLKSGDLLKLYGGNPNQDGQATGPIIEFFNYGNGGIFFNFAQGRLEKPIPSPFTRQYSRDEIGLNIVRNHSLEMTDNRPWVAAGLAFRSIIEGGFTIEFTVWMKDRLQTRTNLGGGDGMVFYVRDADQEPQLALGGAGGGMGYMGLANNGFAIAFDTFRNKEHGDQEFTGSRLSLRLAGNVKHRMLTEMNLPASLNSGTPFRVRISLGTGRKIAIKVYSFAADKSVDIIEDLPADVIIPRRKILGFTASTGTAAQRHILDDIILVPHGK